MIDITPEIPFTVVDPDIAPFSYDTDDQTIYLHSPLELKPAVTLGQGRPNEINGQPVKYFWADGIRAGDYTHPTKGFSLSVNRKRIDGWIENFHKMRGNSVDIPACADHSEKARDSLGYVVDMKRDGDTLKVLHQMIGEDAIRMASRNKISLGIHPNFKDGRGNVYGDSIVHSALTSVPVVPSSEGLIAASRGQQTEPVILTLAALRSTAMPFSAQQLDEIRKLPGAGEIPEDGAAAWLLSYAQTTAQNVVTLSTRVQSAEAQIQTLSSEDEVMKLSTENESLRTRVQELSAAIPEPVPETALFLMSQSLQTEREAAIASGGIDPATAKLLETMLTNADGKPSVMALSMTRDTKAPVGFELWRALRNNKPINVEHKTGVQALSMATEPPPKPASQDDVANAKEVEETRKMLHLPPKK